MKTKKLMICLAALALMALMIMPGYACELQTELWAGRDEMPVGYVTLDEYGSTIYITYTTTGGWYLVETHLAVAGSFEDIPQTKSGNPKIGHFPYATDHGSGVTQYTYAIPYSGGEIYIAAHAVVGCDCGGDYETAWGEGPTHHYFPGNSWAMYFTYPPP
jgi:hypothetical protein